MKKTILILNYVAVFAVMIMAFPTSSHAYLLPLIGGLGWAIAVIFGALVFVGSYIWLNIKKIKSLFSKKSEQDDKETSGKDS